MDYEYKELTDGAHTYRLEPKPFDDYIYEGFDQEKTVYTGGTFDLFHAGHVDFLRQCKEFGNVVVSLNTDTFIEEFKGKKPIMSYEERKAVVGACRYVNMVMKNIGGSNSRPSIDMVEPDFIAIGSDWLEKDYLSQLGITVKYLEENNIKLIYIPRPADENRISSTNIKERLRNEA
jgi:glycerol-3-phosphate cytidylyltransferase